MPDRPVALPYRFGLPVHGQCVGGYVGTRAHPQPIGQITRLVQGQQAARWQQDITSPLYLPSVGLDIDNGNTWLEHAYLSGTTMTIGGQSIGDQHFLYNDGNRTWLMRWEIDPDPSTSPFPSAGSPYDPVRILRIYVEKMFGEFGHTTDRGTINLLVYEQYFVNANEEFSYTTDVIAANYSQQQSADGTRFLLNCHAVLWVKSLSSQKDFIVLYPWLFYVITAGYAFYRVLLGDYWHCIDISGVGSTDDGNLGEGITATLNSRAYFDYGSRGYVSQETWRVLTSDGTLDMWSIDETHGYTDNYSELYLESAETGTPYSVQFGTDYTGYQPAVGLKLADGGLFHAYQASGGTPICVHAQDRKIAPDNTGRTYDIANDQWFATGCVV